jgi:hypothetical protein
MLNTVLVLKLGSRGSCTLTLGCVLWRHTERIRPIHLSDTCLLVAAVEFVALSTQPLWTSGKLDRHQMMLGPLHSEGHPLLAVACIWFETALSTEEARYVPGCRAACSFSVYILFIPLLRVRQRVSRFFWALSEMLKLSGCSPTCSAELVGTRSGHCPVVTSLRSVVWTRWKQFLWHRNNLHFQGVEFSAVHITRFLCSCTIPKKCEFLNIFFWMRIE